MKNSEWANFPLTLTIFTLFSTTYSYSSHRIFGQHLYFKSLKLKKLTSMQTWVSCHFCYSNNNNMTLEQQSDCRPIIIFCDLRTAWAQVSCHVTPLVHSAKEKRKNVCKESFFPLTLLAFPWKELCGSVHKLIGFPSFSVSQI